MFRELINVDAPSSHSHNTYKIDNPPSKYGLLLPAYCELAKETIKHWPSSEQTPLISMTDMATYVAANRCYCKDIASCIRVGSFKALGSAYAVSVLLLRHLQEKLAKPVTLAELTNEKYKAHLKEITVSCATNGIRFVHPHMTTASGSNSISQHDKTVSNPCY